MLAAQRRRALAKISSARGATVITLIHRQETFSFLGLPLVRHIDIDDAESVLHAIRETPPGRPIETSPPGVWRMMRSQTTTGP